MKLLWTYLKPYSGLIVLTLLLATVNQVFSMLDPLILGKIIDRYATHYKDFTFQQYVWGVLAFIGLALGVAMVSRIAKNFQDYFANVITQRACAKIYTTGLQHSLELPYNVFEDQRSGETLGILTKVRTDVEKFISAFVNVVFVSVVGLVWVMIFSIRVNWIIGPIYMGIIPVIGIVSSVLSRKIKKVQKNIVSETTALAGSTTESLRNIELVKSLGLVKQEIIRLNNVTQKILGLELKKVKYIRSISFVQGTTVNLLRNTILFILLYMIFQGKLHPGEFLTFYFYSFFIFGPLQELGNIILTYREAEASLNNFKNVLSKPIEQKPADAVVIPDIHTITFDNVRFKHATATNYALDDVSFTAEKGETIAFVGPSGSGKTTMIKLLVGLYQPLEGHVYYNNIDSLKIDRDAFREKIGFVTQDTQLFAGSIKENLLFVNPTATDEECMAVLMQAQCQNLLRRADKGLDSMIGEGGVKVSGGEKQRLSIARALLRRPQLLVFDEATSSLDSLTEEEITDTIRQVTEGNHHITVMIAHRLSTIMHADKICVLEHGKIVEQGTHESLLIEKGLYYAMWRQQIGEKRRTALAQV